MIFRPLAALLVLLLVCCLGTTRASTVPTNDATLKFLQSLAVGIPVLAANWTGSSYSTAWLGVSVDLSGHVTVDLSNKGLAGVLPTYATVGSNVLVVCMNLSHNPGLYGRFDENWGQLSLLTTLDLSNTTMYGFLPMWWNGMFSLTTLKLSHVQACGGLPFWSSTWLRTVDLSNAGLNGGLQPSWASMKYLSSVDLSGNKFCGCVPDAWENSTVLLDAVAGMAVTDTTTCNTTNACASAVMCIDPVPPTTTTPTITTKQPGSAAFGSAAVASLVTLAILVVTTLMG